MDYSLLLGLHFRATSAPPPIVTVSETLSERTNVGTAAVVATAAGRSQEQQQQEQEQEQLEQQRHEQNQQGSKNKLGLEQQQQQEQQEQQQLGTQNSAPLFLLPGKAKRHQRKRSWGNRLDAKATEEGATDVNVKGMNGHDDTRHGRPRPETPPRQLGQEGGQGQAGRTVQQRHLRKSVSGEASERVGLLDYDVM